MIVRHLSSTFTCYLALLLSDLILVLFAILLLLLANTLAVGFVVLLLLLEDVLSVGQLYLFLDLLPNPVFLVLSSEPVICNF